MHIGVPKEIKNNEYRVGMIPAAVRELTSRGHTVFVETNAADAIDLSDAIYTRAGARILPNAADVFAEADMIVKVKEPQPQEIKLLQARPDALHLSPSRARSRANQGAARRRYHRHRLRDRHRCARRLAAARADERSRRPHVDPGGRAAASRWTPAGEGSCSAACPACPPRAS